MAFITDGLRQAFMAKHEYETLRDEEKVWGRIQRPLVMVFVTILWLAILVSVFISLNIVFPANGERPFCRDRPIHALHALSGNRSQDLDIYPGAFYLTEEEAAQYYWMVVFIPSAIIFFSSVLYLFAGIAVAYSAPMRHGCLRVVENNFCASKRDEWWMNFGIDDPALQTLAIRILSQTSSSSGCERNRSVFERIHTKRRNRLEYKRLNDLVYTHYNLCLKKRESSRKKASLTDPVSLENVDLTAEWVLEADEDDVPLLDVEEVEDWMDIADAIYDDEGGVRCLSILNIVFAVIFGLLAMFLGSSLLTLGSSCSVALFWCYQIASWGLAILYGGTAFFLRRKAAVILDEGESSGNRNFGVEMLEAPPEVTPEMERHVAEGFKAWMGSSLLSSDEEDGPDDQWQGEP